MERATCADGLLVSWAGGAMERVTWADGLLMSWAGRPIPSKEMVANSPECEWCVSRNCGAEANPDTT